MSLLTKEKIKRIEPGDLVCPNKSCPDLFRTGRVRRLAGPRVRAGSMEGIIDRSSPHVFALVRWDDGEGEAWLLLSELAQLQT